MLIMASAWRGAGARPVPSSTPDQREANLDAPPFETIARTFGFNSEKLAFFLLEPYPRMPSMALTRREADDIAAYIGKLAK